MGHFDILSGLKNEHFTTELQFEYVSQSLLDALKKNKKKNIPVAGKMSKRLWEMKSAVLGTEEEKQLINNNFLQAFLTNTQ